MRGMELVYALRAIWWAPFSGNLEAAESFSARGN